MRQFLETPSATVKQMVIDVLLQINPRGKGCCYMHIGLMVLQQCISMMMVLQCKKNLKPHAGWQCQECSALNLDDVEIGDRYCSACFFIPPVTGHDLNTEEMPSGEADVSGTDVDSLAGTE